MKSLDKDKKILTLCANKKVLHLGATDSPHHIEKAENRELLHQKLQRVAEKLIGIDLDQRSIRELQRYGITNIYKHDITKKFPDEFSNFDIIIMGDVFEHLSNPGLAIENVKKIMTDKTKLIITVPNIYCYFNIFNIFTKKEDVHSDHMFWTSKQTMTQFLNRHKLEIVNFEYLNFGSYDDIKTIKGKIFYNVFLKSIAKIRSVLFFELKK